MTNQIQFTGTREEFLAKAIEWRDARAAFLSLDTADVRKSDDTLFALNRLASAENSLFSALQTPHKAKTP